MSAQEFYKKTMPSVIEVINKKKNNSVEQCMNLSKKLSDQIKQSCIKDYKNMMMHFVFKQRKQLLQPFAAEYSECSKRQTVQQCNKVIENASPAIQQFKKNLNNLTYDYQSSIEIKKWKNQQFSSLQLFTRTISKDYLNKKCKKELMSEVIECSQKYKLQIQTFLDKQTPNFQVLESGNINTCIVNNLKSKECVDLLLKKAILDFETLKSKLSSSFNVL